MPNQRSNLGPKGEKLAKQFLKAKRYRFITQNFRCKIGEIDLVFQDADQLVFVEVKTRSSNAFGHPEVAVSASKIRKISRIGEYFMQTHSRLPQFVRIDVIAIEGEQINHFQNVSM
jgi:putative endonuclease